MTKIGEIAKNGAGERERIARIIDDYGFDNGAMDSLASVARRKDAFAKADAILALSPALDNTAVEEQS